MAIIRNTAAMRLNGSVGNTTYYTQGGRQIARVAQNSSNYGEGARRSPAQQRRRVMWANLVNFYKTSANWMHGAFETKKRNETDYNRFMSLNLPSARIALPKDLAAQGCCIYDTFIVSQGTMHHIDIQRLESSAVTNIKCTISAETIAAATIAGFSSVLIEQNPWLSAGDQLSFIFYDADGSAVLPKLEMIRYEITLDPTNQAEMSTLPVTTFLGSASNRLTWNNLSPDSYMAVILSNSTNGTLRVSTQSLVPGDTEWPAEWSSEAAIQRAIDSYGVDPSYFLESGYE